LGLSLIALTIAIHAIGVVMIVLALLTIRSRLAKQDLRFNWLTPIVICLVASAGLLLAILHGIEAAIWAAAFQWLGAIASPMKAETFRAEVTPARCLSGPRTPVARRYSAIPPVPVFPHGLAELLKWDQPI
jgi:MFS superfamily sulfate permease-like transporter